MFLSKTPLSALFPIRHLSALLIAFGLCLTILLQPGFAQANHSTTPTEDVVVDGRALFQLGSINDFTAERRARSANSGLQVALQTTPYDQPIQIDVIERDQLSTIRVNNRHLLTVTSSDCMTGVSHPEQADVWAARLQTALQRAQKERSPGHSQSVFWRILLALIGAIALNVMLFRLRKQLRRRVQPAAKLSKRYAQSRLILPGLVGLQGAVVIAFVVYVCELLPSARIVRYKTFQFLEDAFNNPLITAAGKNYSLLDIAKLILFVVLLWIGVRSLSSIIKARFLRVAIPDRGLQDAIATLIQFVLMALGLFIVLQTWGIDLSALAILASALGVGLGFGLQNIVNNFISGWILLIERPVQVGDLINLGDVTGSVERIGVRSTELQTADGFSMIVPNSELVQNKVINWSHGQPVIRVQIPLHVAYDSVIDRVHQAVIESAQAHPEVLRYPRPQLRFLGFGDSALDFNLLLWIRDPRHQFDVRSDVYYLLEANLRRYQIKVPLPQRDITLNASQKPDMTEPDITEPAPGIKNNEPPSVPPENEAFPASLLANMTRYSAILKTSTSVATNEIDRLVAQMRGPEGLNPSDRKFRLTVYSNCFVGSEAVTWIVKTQKATRTEAIRLGHLLVERGIIHHVTDEHSFKDEHLFYRFYADEV